MELASGNSKVTSVTHSRCGFVIKFCLTAIKTRHSFLHRTLDMDVCAARSVEIYRVMGMSAPIRLHAKIVALFFPGPHSNALPALASSQSPVSPRKPRAGCHGHSFADKSRSTSPLLNVPGKPVLWADRQLYSLTFPSPTSSHTLPCVRNRHTKGPFKYLYLSELAWREASLSFCNLVSSRGG